MLKKIVAVALILLGVVASGTATAHGVRWSVGVAVGIGFPVYIYPLYPVYYPPVYYPPVIMPPPVYIQQAPAQLNYWYYCEQSRAYHPYVKECPGGWMKVIPPEPPR